MARGQCNCGAVRFEAELPSEPFPALDCNCSICSKTGYLHIIVPHDEFELLSGRVSISQIREVDQIAHRDSTYPSTKHVIF